MALIANLVTMLLAISLTTANDIPGGLDLTTDAGITHAHDVSDQILFNSDRGEFGGALRIRVAFEKGTYPIFAHSDNGSFSVVIIDRHAHRLATIFLPGPGEESSVLTVPENAVYLVWTRTIGQGFVRIG